jgi:hypothetical protein
MEVKLHEFLTWPLDGGACSASFTIGLQVGNTRVHLCGARTRNPVFQFVASQSNKKYMIMFRHPNSEQNQKIRIANESFENVAKFKYLWLTLRNQNDIHDEIKSRINSGNACYYPVQHFLSSCLTSKNLKIKIYKTVILPVVLYGCETWSLTLGGGTQTEGF